MMSALYQEEGSHLRIGIITEQPAQDFINAHAAALDSGFRQVTMSDSMRQRLQRSDYIFSGIKTFHELNEAFPSLIDENGNRKPFEQFLKDVQKIDRTYNQNYLRAEYNFVQASAAMAAKWEEFQKDGDRYNLQYRTAQDDRVREEHAALHGITLPPSDTFWADYYPPNGWNCRCTVVQVRKSKYPETPHDEAMALGEEALGTSPAGASIFHFNPGIEQKTMPDYNPYTIKRCRDCDIAKGNGSESPLSLSRTFIPDNELCAACRLIHQMEKDKEPSPSTRSQVRRAQRDLTNWYKQELPHVMDGKFPARRFERDTKDGIRVIINRNFYDETINKHQEDILYSLKLAYAKKAHELIVDAELTNPNEPTSDHPGQIFRVYEYIDDCYRVEMKVRCNRDGNFMHIIRIYKK
ncbi:MAG: minor capsid protein [Prevotella sp.]|nr:minor capsid protein [Prevotella sp.]